MLGFTRAVHSKNCSRSFYRSRCFSVALACESASERWEQTSLPKAYAFSSGSALVRAGQEDEGEVTARSTSAGGVCHQRSAQMARPVVRYTRTADGLEIAYQVLGEGPIDVVIV